MGRSAFTRSGSPGSVCGGDTQVLERLFGQESLVAASGALDASVLRQQVIANNLANAETPGFKRQEVSFETSLAAALEQQDEAGGPGAMQILLPTRPVVYTPADTSERQDGNNVNIESESVEMAINQLRFETLTESVTNYFRNLQAAIKGQ